MLSNISWTTYFTSVAIVAIAWYIIVGFKYYRSELQSLFKRALFARGEKERHTDDVVAFEREANYNDTDFDDLMPSVEELIAKIKVAIAEASERQYNKAEFTYSLQRILRLYPAVKGSSFQSSIEQLIQVEVQRYGLMTLDTDEMVILWSEVSA